MAGWVAGCACTLTPTRLHFTAARTQLSHLLWLIVALIQSLVLCNPQCTRAFHRTCDKGRTGPVGYCATSNNWIALLGCLATMAGAGSDLVIFFSVICLCVISFSDTPPNSEFNSAFKENMRMELRHRLHQRTNSDMPTKVNYVLAATTYHDDML